MLRLYLNNILTTLKYGAVTRNIGLYLGLEIFVMETRFMSSARKFSVNT
jgi:hypothetical protein